MFGLLSSYADKRLVAGGVIETPTVELMRLTSTTDLTRNIFVSMNFLSPPVFFPTLISQLDERGDVQKFLSNEITKIGNSFDISKKLVLF